MRGQDQMIDPVCDGWRAIVRCLGLAGPLCMLAGCIPRRGGSTAGFEVVTLIFFSHSASSEAEILDTVSDEAQKLRLRP